MLSKGRRTKIKKILIGKIFKKQRELVKSKIRNKAFDR